MSSPRPVTGRPSGPQGTQLFAADDLRHFAHETQRLPGAQTAPHVAVLEGISAGVEGLRLPLRTGRQTIGRNPDNDIIIDEPSVSASHAWIIGQSRQFAIMNTLSTNGTFVNDKRIHEAVLKHNDHVRFGQAEFVFLARARGAARQARVRWIVAGSSMLVGLAALAWWLI